MMGLADSENDMSGHSTEISWKIPYREQFGVMQEFSLDYAALDITLHFERSMRWTSLPTFHIRSILGAHLRRKHCHFPAAQCDTCMLSNICAYSLLFESPLDKSNEIIHGRNRAPHPFVLSHDSKSDNGRSYTFRITLAGSAVQYLPYIIIALVEAGEEGIFRDKIRYGITQLVDANTSVQLDTQGIKSPPLSQFRYTPHEDIAMEDALLVQLMTPLRVKHYGRYTTDFDIQSLFYSMYQRLSSFFFFYSIPPITIPPFNPSSNLTIASPNLQWADVGRFSSRQKASMQLGGAIGTFTIEGRFRAVDLSLLEAASIFHAGKNTAFGLGQISLSRTAQ